MAKRNNNTRIIPFSPIEVVYTNKILKGLDYSVNSVGNGNGMFTSIKVHSDKDFDKTHIKYVCNKFLKKFNKSLHFEEMKDCGLPTGYFNILASF